MNTPRYELVVLSPSTATLVSSSVLLLGVLVTFSTVAPRSRWYALSPSTMPSISVRIACACVARMVQQCSCAPGTAEEMLTVRAI